VHYGPSAQPTRGANGRVGDEKGAALWALAPDDLAGPPAHQRVDGARAVSRRADDLGEANLPRRPSITQAVMKRKVETRRTGEKSRKCTLSTLQQRSLRRYFFLARNTHLERRERVSLFTACAVFLAERVFPAFYFALHDSLRDTGPPNRGMRLVPAHGIDLA
jgi:hypothetical protein